MERIEQIIEDLKGSCNSLDSVCADHGCDFNDLTFDELQQLDNEIFECSECGWWCEMSEQHDADNGVDQLCDDCYDGDEDY